MNAQSTEEIIINSDNPTSNLDTVYCKDTRNRAKPEIKLISLKYKVKKELQKTSICLTEKTDHKHRKQKGLQMAIP